ncbi:MAG: hypothetical protein CMI16_09740 [Opitutaceae bacterium]|nr:hypothetical protein [Opitutaceae bacterium]|tara:strand:+ start:258 stop:1805 length:1548 start_codon:yes stop_codon:yes gene_type:complete
MARIHRLDKETKAHAILTCAECTAREADLEFDDEETDAPLIGECLQSLFSKVKYLKRQAASEYKWTPEFQRMLEHAHSVRQRRVDFENKERLRSRKMRCMACGTWERRCPFTLDILGEFDHKSWFGPSDGIQATWKTFLNDYTALRDSKADFSELPEEDFGSFTLGATCFRRAVLYHQLNTLFMERVWSAHAAVQEYEKTDGRVEEAELLTVDDKDVKTFCDLLARLEMCCADSARAPPELAVDEEMWEKIDDVRASVSKGDPAAEAEVLQERSQATLNAFAKAESPKSPKGHQDEEDASDNDVGWSDEDDDQPEDGSEDGEHSGPPSERGQRGQRGQRGGRGRSRRACVVISDESDRDEEEPVGAPVEGPRRERGRERGRKRGRDNAPAVASECGELDDPAQLPNDTRRAANGFENGVDDEDGEQAAEEQAVDIARVQRPQPQRAELPRPGPSAAEVASNYRASSERHALYRLMTLQVQLMRERRDQQAAVCTENIMLIQRLLTRVEELRHTAE